MENQNELNQKFEAIMQPRIINQIMKEKRPPAKFPELRYLWGITGIVSVALIVLSATISTFLEAL
jgi:hypothetical protein